MTTFEIVRSGSQKEYVEGTGLLVGQDGALTVLNTHLVVAAYASGEWRSANEKDKDCCGAPSVKFAPKEGDLPPVTATDRVVCNCWVNFPKHERG